MKVTPTMRDLVRASVALHHLNTSVTFPPDQAFVMHKFLEVCISKLAVAKHFVGVSWARLQHGHKTEIEHNIDINRLLNIPLTNLPEAIPLDKLTRSTLGSIGHHLSELTWLWPTAFDLIQEPEIPDSWLRPLNVPQEVVGEPSLDKDASFNVLQRDEG